MQFERLGQPLMHRQKPNGIFDLKKFDAVPPPHQMCVAA